MEARARFAFGLEGGRRQRFMWRGSFVKEEGSSDLEAATEN
jgi:hypothetical protein